MRRIGLRYLAVSIALSGCGSSSFSQGDLDATSDSAGAEGGQVADSGEGTDGAGASDSEGAGDHSTESDGGSGADGQTATDGATGPDGSDAAAPGDASTDAEVADVYAADGACNCQPYWCGCGTCDPAQIACTVSPPACTRGCASSCVELAQTTCSCSGGRCVRGGIDASSIGCVQDTDCPAGDCCARAQGKAFCTTAGSTCCSVACP